MINPGQVHVLIIDRDPLAAKAVSTNFAVFGFNVEIAADLSSAQKKIKKGQTDIVLMEAESHPAEAERLISELRALSWEKPMVYFMSANQSSDLEKVFALGADGFLIKPFDASVTRDLIQQSCLTRKQRWMTPYRKETDWTLKQSIEGLSEKAEDIVFGRGGFCVRKNQAKTEPAVDQVVAFEIQVKNDRQQRKISGTGLIRWAKKKAGFGVEIKFLADMGRDLYIEWMEKSQPVSFIPAAQ